MTYKESDSYNEINSTTLLLLFSLNFLADRNGLVRNISIKEIIKASKLSKSAIYKHIKICESLNLVRVINSNSSHSDRKSYKLIYKNIPKFINKDNEQA